LRDWDSDCQAPGHERLSGCVVDYRDAILFNMGNFVPELGDHSFQELRKYHDCSDDKFVTIRLQLPNVQAALSFKDQCEANPQWQAIVQLVPTALFRRVSRFKWATKFLDVLKASNECCFAYPYIRLPLE
jgi:hypothetical protein